MMSGFNINANGKAVFKYSKAKKKTNNHYFPKEIGSKEVYKSTCVNGKSNDDDHDAGCNNRLLKLFSLSLEKVNVGRYIIL